MIGKLPSTSLRRKSVTAVAWSGAEVFLRQGLQLLVAIILARLLGPEEFGTIALLYLFTGLSLAFIDSGFSAALIQRQDISRTDESTVFWFNLGMGAVTATSLILAAPWIAGFFAVPVLVPLTAVLAASLFINALGAIHQTLLSKRLDFRTPMQVGVAATVVSGITAILLARAGYGVWALAAQALVASMVTTGLYWMLSPWRPGRVFSMASARRLFGFGGYLMAAGLMDVAYSRLYSLLIGKVHGVRDLGLYNRAETTKQIPVEGLSGVLARVAFPVFSEAAGDPDKLRRGVRHALRGAMLINVPMMLGLMVTAEQTLRVVFGEQWVEAAPLLSILCLAGLFWPLHVLNLSVLKAQGHARLFFRLEIVKKTVGVVFLLAGLTQGLAGVAWSQVAFGLVAFLINARYTGRYLGYGPWRQFLDFLPILGVSSGMAAIVFLSAPWIPLSPLPSLFLQVALGIAFYVLLLVGLRLRAFKDSVGLIANTVPAGR